MRFTALHSPLVATALAALALTACNRPVDEPPTAGQRVDETIAKVEQKAEEMKSDAQIAANQMGDKVGDAAITVSVNAEFAKDPALSALKINVDTVQGRVVLRGTAPDAKARTRATELASAVKGVVSVDNQLEVRG